MTSLLLQAALACRSRASAARPTATLRQPPRCAALPAAALAFPAHVPRRRSARRSQRSCARFGVRVFVNGDQPIFTDSDGQTPVGYFTSSRPTHCPRSSRRRQTTKASALALSLADVYDIVGDKSIGGEMRVRPSRKAVVLANRILLPLGKEVLDEKKGQVPLATRSASR